MSDVRVFYNEIDPYCCAWLSNLMDAGHIRPGTICDKSIADLTPADLEGYDLAHFFAGIAGWDLALTLAGWRFDGRTVWTGSCPCQPFSAAGKQRGSADERHLWPAWFRLIRECLPASVFGEQIAGAAGYAWWDHVAADLEGEGYAAAACDLGAHSVGSPHIRQRLYWVANTNSDGQHTWSGNERGSQEEEHEHGHHSDRRGDVDNAVRERLDGHRPDQTESRWNEEAGSVASAGVLDAWADLEWLPCSDGKARPTQPGLHPLVDGLPEGVVRGSDRRMAPPDADRSAEARVMRLRGYGNAIVPQLAAAFLLCNFQLQPDETPIR